MKIVDYIIGLVDGTPPYGIKELTPKGKSYSLSKAKEMKKQHEWVEVLPVVILKRTHEVIKNV